MQLRLRNCAHRHFHLSGKSARKAEPCLLQQLEVSAHRFSPELAVACESFLFLTVGLKSPPRSKGIRTFSPARSCFGSSNQGFISRISRSVFVSHCPMFSSHSPYNVSIRETLTRSTLCPFTAAPPTSPPLAPVTLPLH